MPYFVSSPYYTVRPRIHDNPQRQFMLSYCSSKSLRSREDFFFNVAVKYMGLRGVHALGKSVWEVSVQPTPEIPDTGLPQACGHHEQLQISHGL